MTQQNKYCNNHLLFDLSFLKDLYTILLSMEDTFFLLSLLSMDGHMEAFLCRQFQLVLGIIFQYKYLLGLQHLFSIDCVELLAFRNTGIF